MPPELVQFGNLTPEHFARCPVWIGCHTCDHDEPWYEDTDEETFRPWLGALPVDYSEGMLLARALFTLNDGSQFGGFLTPAPAGERMPNALGIVQPQLFLPSGTRLDFWDGLRPRGPEGCRTVYEALSRTPDRLFPIQFVAEPGLVRGLASGQIQGFYSRERLNGPVKISR